MWNQLKILSIKKRCWAALSRRGKKGLTFDSWIESLRKNGQERKELLLIKGADLGDLIDIVKSLKIKVVLFWLSPAQKSLAI